MELQDALVQSHRRNLERYRRLQTSSLTELESRYIEARIADETSALERLLRHPIDGRQDSSLATAQSDHA
jgi:hypothetical protein